MALCVAVVLLTATFIVHNNQSSRGDLFFMF